MEENIQRTETTSLNSIVGGKMRTNVAKTRRPAPYAKSSSRKRYHQIQEPSSDEKGIIGRVTNLIVPSWISNWWNPMEDNEVPQDEDSNDSEDDDSIEQTSNGPSALNKPLIFKKPVVKHTRVQVNDVNRNDNTDSTAASTLQHHLFSKPDKKATQPELSARPAIKKQTIDFLIEKTETGRKRKSATEDDSQPTVAVESSTTKQNFYDSFRSNQKLVATSKPAFNVSAFVSPKTQSTGYSFNNTSLNTSSFNFTSARSPFYSGSTTYGGSSSIRESSSKRARLSPVSNSVRTTRTHVRAKPLSSTKRNMVTSDTAKRILSTLGKMSTPLKDSRTLPNVSKSGPSFNEMLKANNQKNKIAPNQPPTTTLSYSKTAEIAKNVHSKVDSINRFNEKTAEVPKKLVSFSSASTFANNSFIQNQQTGSSANSTVNQQILLPSNPSTKSPPTTASNIFESTSPKKTSMKIRREKTAMHYSSNTENAEVVNTMPEVTQTSMALPVTSLPKFNFSAIKPSFNHQVKFPTSSPSITPIIKTSHSKIAKQKDDDKISFMFSLPEVITSELPAPLTGDFAFSSPVNLTANTKPKDHSTPEVAKVVPRKFKNFHQPPEGSWDCPTCMINNKKDSPKCVACTESKPGSKDNTQSAGIVEPKFGNMATAEKQSINNYKLNIAKLPEGSWPCPVCMINNDRDKMKCEACSEPKPGPMSSITTLIPPSKNTQTKQLKLKFSQPEEGSWECPTCMINNKKDLENCAACSEPNPRTKKDSTATAGTQDIKIKHLKMKFQQNTLDTWECPTCMISNKNEVSKCVACSESKPGTENQKTTFFGASSNPSGLSGFSSNTGSTSSGFSFSASNTASSGFSFNAPKSNTLSGFSFGTSAKTSSSDLEFGAETKITTTEKKDINNGFSFNSIENKDTQPPPFSFGNKESKDSTTLPTFGFGGSSNANAKNSNDLSDTNSFFFSKPAATNIPSSGFSFGSNQNSFNMTQKETNSNSLHFPATASTIKDEAAIKPAFQSIADAAKSGFLKVPEAGSEKSESQTTGFQFGNANSNAKPIFGGFAQKSIEPSLPTIAPVFGTTTAAASSFSFPSASTAPVSNATFNFGSAPVVTSQTLTFGSKPDPLPVFGSTTGIVFGNSNNSSGGVTFNFGPATAAAAPPKPPATYNFGSTATVPTFETKQTSFDVSSGNQGTVTPFQAPNNDVKVNPGFSFSTGAPPSFNFGSSSNLPSFTATNNLFGQSAAPSGNLFSMGTGQSPGGNLFNVGKSNSSGGAGPMKRQIRKAARRIKK